MARVQPRIVKGESMQRLRYVCTNVWKLILVICVMRVEAQVADETPDTSRLEAIVVTAEKREQSVDVVPMSITAFQGDELAQRGLNDIQDLEKVVPGLTYTETNFGPPTYTLRGIGFYDSSLAASPAVSVYVAEVPLPYSIMSSNAALDLERVEVLKGPQGTLFGQNSTGGAINYVPAEPTRSFSGGANASYGRFNVTDIDGFVSGPVTTGVTARAAMRIQSGDGWQDNYTRGGTLGRLNRQQARLLLNWKPDDALKIQLNLNTAIDRSETPAVQLVAVTPDFPALVPPALSRYSLPPRDSRAADWTPGIDYRRNDAFYQAAARVTYDVSREMTLVSITSYAHAREYAPLDQDGTALLNSFAIGKGNIHSFIQELRLQSDGPNGNWIVGANYETDAIYEHTLLLGTQTSLVPLFPVPPGPPGYFEFRNTQEPKTSAVFGNAELPISSQVSVFGGMRYTHTDRSLGACLADPGDGQTAAAFTSLYGLLGIPAAFSRGGCVTLDRGLRPALVQNDLRESNVSWRAGVNWTPNSDTLGYLSASKGYKAGGFPALGASSYTQFAPARQESLLAYEVGIKRNAFGHTLHVDGALFYYDYVNKQIRGRFVDPIFGVLESLVNVPKSHVAGADLQLDWIPIEHLKLHAGATYLRTTVSSDFMNYSPLGVLTSFKGDSFPYTPNLQGIASLEYKWPAGGTRRAFIGGGVTYKSSTSAAFAGGPLFSIDAYALLDLRAGMESADGRWRLTAWGHNVTNKYYWNNVIKVVDTIGKYAGMPATYGITLSYRE
jgi:iron complex outermembrane recepter protein